MISDILRDAAEKITDQLSLGYRGPIRKDIKALRKLIRLMAERLDAPPPVPDPFPPGTRVQIAGDGAGDGAVCGTVLNPASNVLIIDGFVRVRWDDGVVLWCGHDALLVSG